LTKINARERHRVLEKFNKFTQCLNSKRKLEAIMSKFTIGITAIVLATALSAATMPRHPRKKLRRGLLRNMQLRNARLRLGQLHRGQLCNVQLHRGQLRIVQLRRGQLRIVQLRRGWSRM